MIDLKSFKVIYRGETYTVICAEPVFTNYESPDSDGMYNPSILHVWVLNDYGHLTVISSNYYDFKFIKEDMEKEE